MTFVSTLLAKCRAAFHPDRVHHEISEELRFHLEMKTADLVRSGMPLDQAQNSAARTFGSVTRIGEQGYDVRGRNQLEELAGNIRFAFRLMRKQPAKTAILILTLALGIGLNTATFGILRSILLQPLPFRDAGQLVILHQANHGQLSGVSYPHFQDWRQGNHSLLDLAVYSATSATLTGQGDPTRIYGATASSSLFPVLGVLPLRGRLFREQEDLFPGSKTAGPLLISDRLWRSRFQERDDILGRLVHLDGREFTIVGIIAANFAFPIQKEPVDFWTTVAPDADPTLYGGTIPISRGYPRYDGAVARLKPGVTLAQAAADLTRLAGTIAREHPKTTSSNDVAMLSAIEEIVGPSSRTMIFLLYGAVFCVLVVACVNVANLLLVDAVSRQREFSLRTALGAPVSRLVRQALVESLLLALAGGVASFGITLLSLHLFVTFAPPDFPRLQEIHLDASVFFYTLGVSLLSGLLFGCLPALFARKYDLTPALKQSAPSVSGKASGFQWGPLLICGQIAISMVLLCAAIRLATSFDQILHSARGFNAGNVLTASISLPVTSYGQGSQRVSAFYESLLQQLRSTPGVRAATLSEILPLSGQTNSTTVEVDGTQQQGFSSTGLRFVDSQYFATLQIPLLSGRAFNSLDGPAHPASAIVNQSFVHRFLQGKDPLQSKLRLGWGGTTRKRIIGVVADIRPSAISPATAPEVYVPFTQFPLNDMSILVRTAGEPADLTNSLQTLTHHLDPSLPVDRIRTLNDYLLLSSAPQQFLMWLLVAFATTTLLLAAVGLYGVLSSATASRTREFGIRLALGASRGRVISMVMGQGVLLAAIGLALGAILTFFSSRVLTRWLFDAHATGPEVFFLGSGILLIVVLAACAIPSRRAASTDPASSLRMS